MNYISNINLKFFRNAPRPSFESLCFNPFLVKDSLNDTNQDPDVNFYNDISSVETSYLSPCKANNKLKSFTFRNFFNSSIKY